mgnify:CR=1 FL=1
MEGCKNCEYVADDETCGAFECNGSECPELPCEKYWYFTFCCNQEHAGRYVKIRGTFRQARQKMFDKYSDQWGFQYSEKEWNDIKNDPKRYWDMETELETIE